MGWKSKGWKPSVGQILLHTFRPAMGTNQPL